MVNYKIEILSSLNVCFEAGEGDTLWLQIQNWLKQLYGWKVRTGLCKSRLTSALVINNKKNSLFGPMIQNFRWKSMNSSRICTCEGCESKSFHFCGNDIVGAQKAAEQAKRKCFQNKLKENVGPRLGCIKQEWKINFTQVYSVVCICWSKFQLTVKILISAYKINFLRWKLCFDGTLNPPLGKIVFFIRSCLL